VTRRLKAGRDLQKASVSRQRPVNTVPRQPKHAPAPTFPGPSLGNSPLNTSRNNGGILGSGVFYAVRAEAIWRGRKRKPSEGLCQCRPDILPSSKRGPYFSNTYMSRIENKSWSKVSTRPEAKNNCAGEGRQQFNRPTAVSQ
jgi:hypothetical protein